MDGNGTVTATGNVDTNTPGSYTLSYNFTDSGGNAAITVTRTVTVVDTTAPVLYIIGDQNITHEAGKLYTDANASWSDHVDGSGTVRATGNVDTNRLGSYALRYNFTDSGGNAANAVTRIVTVVDTIAPVITINGTSSITQEVGTVYLDANATWSDVVDGNGTISATGNVNINVPGTYKLTYNYIDSSGNIAITAVRQVIIEENSENDDTELTSFQDNWMVATPVEGLYGWWESQWMGFYSADSYPWIYHQNLGWIFVSIESSEVIWFYHSRLGWLWTNPYQFPYLYLDKRDQWIYLNQSAAKTTVYDYQEEEWFEPDTPIEIFGEVTPSNSGDVIGFGNYYRWETVRLEAKAKSDSNFAGWSGDLNSMETVIEFEAIRNSMIDASFLIIPSGNTSGAEIVSKIKQIVEKMDHLTDAEKEKSIAELLIFGTSSTSGHSIKKEP